MTMARRREPGVRDMGEMLRRPSGVDARLARPGGVSWSMPADDQPGEAPVSRHTTSYERSPVDVLRLAVGVGLLVALFVILALFGNSVVVFVNDLLRGVDAVPQWLVDTLVVGTHVLALVLLVAGLVAAATQRRWRLVLTAAAAALVAALVEGAVHSIVTDEANALATVSTSLGPLTDAQFPSGVGVAVIAAVTTAIAPWVPRRWRQLAWALVVAVTVARFVTAPTSFDSLIALLVGWVIGSLALVVAGGPVHRPTEAAVADGLASVGVPVASIAKASVDARGSTPYFASTAEGEKLFVKALGADERSADLLFRAYRKLMPHDLGDERSFSTLRRTVEHEALVALTARDLGVRTPRFRAFGWVEPNAFVLAYEGIDGSSLDGVEAEKFDDALLRAVWDQVATLRRHRIAHRDLRLANVFRATDGQVWMIDFGFSELAASDLLLANDLAELLASTSLVVGCDRAVAAGAAALDPAELAVAATRLRPFALSGATRTGMKQHPGLLDTLRTNVEDLAPS